MELEVESARVADGLALVVPPPKSRGGRAAVGALQARPTIPTLKESSVNLSSQPPKTAGFTQLTFAETLRPPPSALLEAADRSGRPPPAELAELSPLRLFILE